MLLDYKSIAFDDPRARPAAEVGPGYIQSTSRVLVLIGH